MSRVGKQIVEIPQGVEVTLSGKTLNVKGPKGTLTRDFKTNLVSIEIKDKEITFVPKNEEIATRALWGTYASHVKNMLEGVTKGYEKKLEIEGVGYRAEITGKDIKMLLGFSHPVMMTIPENVSVVVEKNIITVSGIDKEAVGEFAANIRAKKKPEPYKGKGIHYVGEYIRRKQGKKSV